MPKVGHEALKGCGGDIWLRMRAAKWQYNGEELSITREGGAVRTLVRKDNSTINQEPDEFLSVSGAEYPFLIVEVRDGQNIKDLGEKVHRWIQWSKNKVKIVCVFEIEPDPENSYRVLATIIKARRKPAVTPQKPNGFIIEPEYVFDRVDISTEEPQGAFTISATEVYPEEWTPDPAAIGNCVTITLASFRSTALEAIIAKVEQRKRDSSQGGPSPYNSDQEGVSTPSSSGSLQDEWQRGSEPDDLTDGDYVP
ncbi:MAG: hypothetical protein Q9188_005376 [Gyalolechia gomerana]